MSDQNKNANPAQADTVSKPALADNEGTNPSTEKRDQTEPKAPDHEQGREYTPNVDAQKEAADARRTVEQAHVPTATADNAAKQNESTSDRKNSEAGDAERIVAEGQGDGKSANEPAKLVAGSDSSGKS